MKKLIWIVLAVFIFSCQVQEPEVLSEYELDEELDDESARKRPEGDNGPTVIPDGVEPCATSTYDLFAGIHKDVGSVTIANDNEYLYVTYFTTKKLGRLHLWFGHSLRDMPLNPAGIPIIGHFFMKADAKGKSQYTFKISFEDLAKRNIVCDNNLILVAHAEVGRESAFGGTTQIGSSKRWAYYMKHTLVCCDDGGGGNEDDDYEDPGEGRYVALAKGNWVFVEDGCSDVNPECLPGLGIANTRWGWAINASGITGVFYDLWASGEQNDVNNGFKVGRAGLEYVPRVVNGVPTARGSITVTLNDGWVMDQLNIYGADGKPISADPALFGTTVNFSTGAFTYTYTINFENSDPDSDGVWFIVHAIVRPSI